MGLGAENLAETYGRILIHLRGLVRSVVIREHVNIRVTEIVKYIHSKLAQWESIIIGGSNPSLATIFLNK